jgi:uncharacterized membrane protein YfcA
VIGLGLPAVITAQLGVLIAKLVPQYMLLAGFGALLLFNWTVKSFFAQRIKVSRG